MAVSVVSVLLSLLVPLLPLASSVELTALPLLPLAWPLLVAALLSLSLIPPCLVVLLLLVGISEDAVSIGDLLELLESLALVLVGVILLS